MTNQIKSKELFIKAFETNDIESKKQLYLKSLELWINPLVAHNLGMIYFSQRKKKKSIKYIKLAIETLKELKENDLDYEYIRSYEQKIKKSLLAAYTL